MIDQDEAAGSAGKVCEKDVCGLGLGLCSGGSGYMYHRRVCGLGLGLGFVG